MRVYFLNCVSTPKDYRILGFGASSEPPEWPDRQKPYVDKIDNIRDITWLTQNLYPQPDVPKHGSAVLGLPDAAEILHTCDPMVSALWLKLLNASVGAPAWTLVAYAVWMIAVPVDILMWMDDIGWFDHDVRDAIAATKNHVIAARRMLTLNGYPEVTVDDVLLLRKIANISNRTKEEADWDAERHRRTVNTSIHWYPMPDGTVSRNRWLQEMRKFLEQFTESIARKMALSLRLVDIKEWWDSRYIWVSAGSSSNAAAAKGVLEQSDMEPDKQCRPNKKAVAVTLPDSYIWLQMMKKPVKRPRKSTKNEPGNKNRAVYAQDDESFFVSSYASVAMERSINEDGIYARQAPADVVNWVKNHHQLSKSKMFFLSLDYSDYNTEHEPTTLAMLDAAWAKAWSRVAGNNNALKQKAWAALWSAEAHLNAWTDFGYGEERVLNGLFSGDRNTSRDNCILHAAYSHIMQLSAKQSLPTFTMAGTSFTGDDEDAAMGSSVQAACYMSNHARAGFDLKVDKQLAGTHDLPTHEYLQRALTTCGRPSRPLAAALAQAVSGNWYKTQYTWFDSVIDSTNDSAWELHTRGLPLQYARFMACKVLARTLNVPDGDGWRKLEWWNYRTNGRYHALWGTVTKAAPALPDQAGAISADPNHHGIQAWKKLMVRRFGRDLPSAKADRYAQSCAQQAFANIFLQKRFRLLADAAAEVWPTRVTKLQNVIGMELVYTPKISEQSLVKLVTNSSPNNTPTTTREVLSRYGVDDQLVEALGGIKQFLRTMRPSDMQWWTETLPPVDPPEWGCHEDPAIRSYVTSVIRGTARQYQRAAGASPGLKYALVVAGNAAGKTSAMANTMSGILIDMDGVMRKSGVMAIIKNSKTAYSRSLPSILVDRAATQLMQTAGEIIMTQYPVTWITQILDRLGALITGVAIVSTPADTIWERASCDRAWSMAKAIRREARFARVASAWRETPEAFASPSVMAATNTLVMLKNTVHTRNRFKPA